MKVFKLLKFSRIGFIIIYVFIVLQVVQIFPLYLDQDRDAISTHVTRISNTET